MQLSKQRLPALVVGTFQKYPWIGWAVWAVVVAAVLLRMHPRRFGSAFRYYMEFAEKLWNEQTIYDPSSLGDISYWPTSLLLFVPVTPLDHTTAATILFALFAAFLSYAAVVFTRAMLDDRPDAIWVAGFLLVVNVWPGWYHFKQVQLHIPMVAAMMLASAALIRGRHTLSALWLSLALIAKPISLVMVLLAGALVPRMRLLLIAGIVVGFALPFAFVHADYLFEQYRLFGLKLWSVASAPPGDWIYQSDFSTLLRFFGIVFPGSVAFAIRVLAGIGTLWLAWQVQRTGHRKALAIALLVLSGCYLGLFGPRNEHVSYLVSTPGITAVAFLLLLADARDLRGWLLILACQVLGFYAKVEIDIVTKPAVMVAIYAWLTCVMARPQRFCDIVDRATAPAPNR